MGTQITMKGVPTETAKFHPDADDEGVQGRRHREVVPGSDEVGMVAAGGNVPIGYFKDPEKSERDPSARSTACATRSPATSRRSRKTAH